MTERYGTHRPLRRAVLVTVSVLVGALALGWLAWATVVNANPAVQAPVTGFKVVSAHRVEVTLDIVLRDRTVRGTCLLRASAEDHAIVGELDLRVDQALAAHPGRFSVRTERRATTVETISCTADGG